MPQFLDHHRAPGPPPQEIVSQIADDLKAGGHTDPATGVKGIAWMYSNNEQWCVTEAPNPDAVHKYHEAMGVQLDRGEITEVNVVR